MHTLCTQVTLASLPKPNAAMTLFLLSSQEPTPTIYLEDAGFKNKRLVLGSNTDTVFTNNYQSTIKAIKKHLGFDI